jgi:hypothetical protein
MAELHDKQAVDGGSGELPYSLHADMSPLRISEGTAAGLTYATRIFMSTEGLAVEGARKARWVHDQLERARVTAPGKCFVAAEALQMAAQMCSHVLTTTSLSGFQHSRLTAALNEARAVYQAYQEEEARAETAPGCAMLLGLLAFLIFMIVSGSMVVAALE